MQQTLELTKNLKKQVVAPNGKRILFANVPADGHFNPLTGIAKYLLSQGYVLVTQGTVEKDIEKILVPTFEAFRDTDTLVIATTEVMVA